MIVIMMNMILIKVLPIQYGSAAGSVSPDQLRFGGVDIVVLGVVVPGELKKSNTPCGDGERRVRCDERSGEDEQ